MDILPVPQRIPKTPWNSLPCMAFGRGLNRCRQDAAAGYDRMMRNEARWVVLTMTDAG